MIRIPKGRYIGIATTTDLSDMQYGKAWADLQLNTKDRVHSFPHSDGTDRWGFPLHNIFIVISSSIVLA